MNPCRSSIAAKRTTRPARRLAPPVAVLALALFGCATSPDDALTDLPSLDEVRSEVTPPGPPQAEPSQQQPRRPRVEIAVEQIELPLDVPLSELWENVDEDVVEEGLRGAWRSNGLRIGVVRAEHRKAFAETLPEDLVLGLRRHRINSRSERVALRGGPRLDEPVSVHTPANANAARAYEAERGRLRLMGRARLDQQGRQHLEVVPQHHRRRHVVQPRHPREREFDGEVFESLAAVVALSGHELLVIGLHDPWSGRDADSAADNDGQDEAEPDTNRADQPSVEHEDESDTGSESGSGSEPGSISESDSEPGFELRRSDETAPPTLTELRRHWQETYGERPELSEHFGRSVLTQQRGEHGVQVLMILSAHPAATRRAGRE